MCRSLLLPDPVAVVSDVEEKLGVNLDSEDAAAIRTMGELYDYVHARVDRGQRQECVTGPAFYRLRRALVEVCGVPRGRVRPNTRLEDLLPLSDRRRQWEELGARLAGLNVPELCWPSWMERLFNFAFVAGSLTPFLVCIVVCVLVGISVPAAACTSFVLVPGGIVAMFFVARVWYRRTARHAVHIPLSCVSVREMVYTLVSRGPAGPMVTDEKRVSDKEIWGVLCAIVGDEFDKPAGSFTRDSTLY